MRETASHRIVSSALVHILREREVSMNETFNNLLCSRDVVLANACVPQIGIKLENVYIRDRVYVSATNKRTE